MSKRSLTILNIVLKFIYIIQNCYLEALDDRGARGIVV